VAEAESTLKLRQESFTESERVLASARARVTSGAGMPIEVATAEGERGAARAAVLDAEGSLTEARARLRYALGVGPEVNVEAVGELGAVGDAPVDAQALVRQAEQRHPDLQVAAARARRADKETKLASATHAPWIGVGGSFLREGTGDRIWMGVVSVPLPVVSAGAFDRARQRAAAETAAAEVDVTRRVIARDVRLALHEREHAREVREAIRSGARAPLVESYRLAKVGYEVGTQDLSAVLLARQRLLAAEEQVVRASADVERADVRLASASGALLGEITP
jgi:cobalt-zinc-cadmium efflux system outer membrane protein